MTVRVVDRANRVAGDGDPLPTLSDWLDVCADNDFRKAQAEAREFILLGQLAHLAPPTSSDDPTTVWFSDVPDFEEPDAVLYVAPIPSIQQTAIVEYATRTGRSISHAKSLVLDALLVRQRLPKMWQMIADLRLTTRRARQIVQECLNGSLPLEGWLYVDRTVAAYTRRLGPVLAERLVRKAFELFAPEELTKDQDRHHVTFTKRPGGKVGDHTELHARLDPADALAFEQALKTVAEDLRNVGDRDPLDERMAKAVGVIGQAALDANESTLPAPPSDDSASPVPRTARNRRISLFALVNADTFTGGEQADSQLEVNNTHLIDVEQLKRWCSHPDAAVTVTPVVDLRRSISSTCYPPSMAQRAHVALSHGHCMFPNCDHPVRPIVVEMDENGAISGSWDADHIVPYRPGQVTSTEDLAPLCRTHHRMKTLKGWAYTRVADRTYLWTSPHNVSFLVTPDATIELPVPHRADRIAQWMWTAAHPDGWTARPPDPDAHPGVAEWDGRPPDDP